MCDNEDMMMEDAIYPWLASDCMADVEPLDFDPEDEDDEDEFEDDGQPEED